MSNALRKAYTLRYRGIYVVVELVKNGRYRWYTSALNDPQNQQDIKFSFGSDAITHWGAIKEVKKHIDERITRIANLYEQSLKSQQEDK